MKKNNEIYCNVCLTSNIDDPNVVFIQAIYHNENIDVCTSCMPTLIHSCASAIKSNEEVAAELGSD